MEIKVSEIVTVIFFIASEGRNDTQRPFLEARTGYDAVRGWKKKDLEIITVRGWFL